MRTYSALTAVAASAVVGALMAAWGYQAVVGALVGGVRFGWTLPWFVRRMYEQDTADLDIDCTCSAP